MLSRRGYSQELAEKARRENFPVASRLLPRRHRDHLMAVYGFARSVDDVGDEAHPDDRPRLLDAYEADLVRLYDGREPLLRPVRALARTVRECSIPAEPFHHLIEANRRDQSVTRYETFDDLLGYCSYAANPVGRLVLHVFGEVSGLRLALSDRVCSALQVIELCQDVGEDHRRGRVYLPEEDLRRAGCPPGHLAAATTSPPLRAVVAVQAARAAKLLGEGEAIVASLSGFARTAVAGYVAGGHATLAALAGGGYDVLGRAVRPRRPRLVAAWARVLMTTRSPDAALQRLSSA
ncbi:All-trans-phytoene synthase [Nonomuraea coxensis DSM 45129]|uniref:All-trans-phytoene synthase n=1 Tax=Nonomuraea coxensis DSM 45129 TaxID=1122611 RepID=A0ABX8UDI8_9ACTN|nr:squalene synthase HpnC [Nonomuraea coxensis]QYC45861.1 All-trans-phytoene synthase [Nonomuraea coxensis DSM 45129]